MASALNQTPATGADAIWTLIQVWLHPRQYQPVIPPPAVIDCGCACAPCGCGTPDVPYAPFSPHSPVPPSLYGGCSPCGPVSVPPDYSCLPDWGACPPCGWSATQSGFPGGGYTLCGLLQKSAADFAIASSWAVIQTPPYITSPKPPGGVVYHRQFCIQRGSDNTQWRVKYSARAGFTGGTPGANQTPSATDEQIIVGGGTDASPTFGTLLPPDGTYRLQIMVYEGGLSPGFYSVTYPLGDPTPNSCFMLDALAPGSYPVDSAGLSLDQDPVVIYQQTGSNVLRGIAMASETAGWRGWLQFLQPGASYTRVPSDVRSVYDSGGVLQVDIPRGLAQTPLRPDDIVTSRASYVRRAALGGTTGRKGDASAWIWDGIVGSQQGLLVGQITLTGVTNPYFWVCFGDVLLRWDGITPKVLL